MKLPQLVCLVGWCALGFAPPLAAGTKTIGAGGTLQLKEDLVLTGDDVLEIDGTAEKPCTLMGNQHGIRSGLKWTGSVKIAHCSIQKLGGPAKRSENGQVTGPGSPAFDLKAAGKGSITVERQDAGFGKHDVPVGGAKDAQAEPKFKGPIPKKFPFADEDIRTGKVTVAQIGAAYCEAYTPADGSPLIGAGDPADGAGSFIGAVGAGKDPPNDQFGRFGKAKQ